MDQEKYVKDNPYQCLNSPLTKKMSFTNFILSIFGNFVLYRERGIFVIFVKFTLILS